MMDASSKKLIGEKWGRFRFLDFLGAGGMAQVYRAKDELLHREVAIKLLDDDFANSSERLRRLQREARAAGSLNHANVLTVYDLGCHNGQHFLVTELLHGATLKELIENQPVPFDRAIDWAVQIAEGLAAVHALGIVHRDLKPGNLFVTGSDCVKILDFGLAKTKCVGSVGLDDTITRTVLTREGTVVGTVGYMSPEQVRGEVTDQRSDIFSYGCVLHEIVSGQRAFRRPTAVETMTSILQDAPPPRVEITKFPQLSAILARCLAKRPKDRFESAKQLLSTLNNLQCQSDDEKLAPRSDKRRQPSVAVLPFANLSADPEQEYFCDGIAEEIINSLAHVEGLRVVARTSSFAFKGKNEDIRLIGQRLNVESVLEGSVRKSRNRLRIAAQLIDVHDGFHRWSDRFDRNLEDVFAIQEEIAMSVVDSLKISLLGEDEQMLARRYTDNLEVYNLYLQGLHHWHKLTPEGFARSIELFQRTLEMDAGFAPALVWIGIWQLSQCYWADSPPSISIASARDYAERALVIDKGIAEAHTLLGVAMSFFDLDREAGEERLRLATRLGPNLASTHTNLAHFLMTKGWPGEATVEARKALALDPLSITTNAWNGSLLAHVGHPQDGIDLLRSTIQMHPDAWLPHHALGDAILASDGDLEQALQETEQAIQLSGGLTVPISRKAILLYLLDRTDQADEVLSNLEARSDKGYVAPTLLAMVHLSRGRTREALEYLSKAVECHDGWLVFARLWRAFVHPEHRHSQQVDTFLDQLGI